MREAGTSKSARSGGEPAKKTGGFQYQIDVFTCFAIGATCVAKARNTSGLLALILIWESKTEGIGRRSE
jgi:hypothetical protein